MSKWSYFTLAVLGLLIASAVAAFQPAPGYMDADYYFGGGVRLAEGYGYTEQILWNYLDDPAGLPHPSHGYWMPLVSILAAMSMAVTGGVQFANARIVFLLLSAFVPPLTARLCLDLGGRRNDAWLAGLLACLPGFYLPYLSITESFGLYMILGVIFLLLVGRFSAPASVSPPTHVSRLQSTLHPAFLIGVTCGLMHLTRADGFLWLGIAVVWVWLGPSASLSERLYRTSWISLGYLLCMGPWMARNLAIFGTPLSPGGGRALWITDYDELYIFPAGQLTMSRWWQAGLGSILQARGWAAGLNLQTALAVQGEIFLAPLILAGMWRLRHHIQLRTGVLAWLVTFLVMTVIFPLQGARGGFFHSGAALQPLFWAAVPFGLDAFIGLGNRLRGWNLRQARRFFVPGLVFLAFFFNLVVVLNRLGGLGSDGNETGVTSQGWGAAQRRYVHVESALQSWDAPAGAIVMTNNPPGYWVATRRPAISIPYGDLRTVFDVAQRYQARYLLLEIEQISGDELYAQPGDRAGLCYMGTVEGVRVYEIGFP